MTLMYALTDGLTGWVTICFGAAIIFSIIYLIICAVELIMLRGKTNVRR